MLDFVDVMGENISWKNGQIGRLPRLYPVSTEVSSVSTLPVLPDSIKAVQHGVPTSLYRYFDRHGILLYVGITGAGIRRNRQHNADKEWWRFVVSQRVEHFASRELAHAQEIALIERFRPPFNKQHNPDHAPARRLYLDMVEAGAVVGGKPLERVQHGRAVQFTVRASSQPGECELLTPFGDVVLGADLRHDPQQPACAYLEDLTQVGRVFRVDNLHSHSVVYVRLRPAWQDASVETAHGQIKMGRLLTNGKLVIKRMVFTFRGQTQ